MNVTNWRLEGKAIEDDSLLQIREYSLSVHVYRNDVSSVVRDADTADILTGLERERIRCVVHQVEDRYAVSHGGIQHIAIRGIAHIATIVYCSQEIGKTI